MTLLLADKACTSFRIKRERLEIDLPVKCAKVSDFSQIPKYF